MIEAHILNLAERLVPLREEPEIERLQTPSLDAMASRDYWLPKDQRV